VSEFSVVCVDFGHVPLLLMIPLSVSGLVDTFAPIRKIQKLQAMTPPDNPNIPLTIICLSCFVFHVTLGTKNQGVYECLLHSFAHKIANWVKRSF